MSDSDIQFGLDTPVEEARAVVTTPCEFICGVAGSGKTYSVRERIAADPEWGLLCATTGIAAVNLGDAVTVNSTLGFFDTDSLRDSYLQGHLTRRLHALALEYRRIMIDEISMMDGQQLDLIVRALDEANGYVDIKIPMGITLVGDFAQLPPIRAKWAFEAEEWYRFEAATTRLTKVWRQDHAEFLQALNFARGGLGMASSDILSTHGVEWHTSLDTLYDGTTIVPKNDQVSRFNGIVLDRLPGQRIVVQSRRWGKQRGEWKNIPDRDEFKVGAYVMILSNSPCEDGQFEYVNGDCGHVEGYEHDEFAIRLVRNDKTVKLRRIVRDCSQKDEPAGLGSAIGNGSWLPRPHLWARKKRYVLGQVEYYPLRLAYASTVHKSQGLSLDRIQVDIRDPFFASPGMIYVALSRCRTLGGLRIVGQRDRFIKQCKCEERIRPWL